MSTKENGFFGITISPEVMRNRDLTSAEKMIYAYIISYSSKVCFDSNGRIGERLGLDTKTVQRALSKLQKYGFIFITNPNSKKRKIHDVFGKPHKYRVLSTIEFSTGNSRNAKQV